MSTSHVNPVGATGENFKSAPTFFFPSLSQLSLAQAATSLAQAATAVAYVIITAAAWLLPTTTRSRSRSSSSPKVAPHFEPKKIGEGATINMACSIFKSQVS
jgi:hypothetical protein